MLHIVHRLLDFIFPPRADENVVRALSDEVVSKLYMPRIHETIQYLLPYQTEIGQALIRENKFHNNQLAAKHLADILSRYLNEQQSSQVVLIPIPLSSVREKKRGYNQVTEILKHLSLTLKVTVDTTSLKRQKDTVPQTSLKRQARLSNMKGVFVYQGQKNTLENSVVIIIDDVVTTGATLVAARAALAPQLPPTSKVILLALAH
jgi:ComF family protein